MRLLRGLRDTTPVGPTMLSTAWCQLPSTVHQLPRTYISATPPTRHPSVHCPPQGMRPGTPPHPSLVCCVKGRVGLGLNRAFQDEEGAVRGGGRAFPSVSPRSLTTESLVVDRKMSPVLQEARVDILDLNLCNSTLWYRGRIRSTNVCAGYPEGNIDTCQGDSGGPLMCRGSEDAYVVVGITSWGVGCARAKRPGIYTSTWPYLTWIASKIGIQALQMAQPAQQGTPAPPSTATNPTQVPSANPPWYFQHFPQPLPLRPPASRPRPPAAPSPRPPAPPSPQPPKETQ
ncbi:acrosin [Myotis myotis]|uniref:acrosin n=1 Tax=Myotis myotis TaxID=51298 RepID=UPI00174952BA|nr:acrosin [Myotis myotis]